MHGGAKVGFGQDHDEFLAAVAACDVFAAAMGLQQAAEAREQGVAAVVAMHVVEGLEMVEVQHQQRQRQLPPFAAAEFTWQRLLQRSEEHTSELQSLMRISY